MASGRRSCTSTGRNSPRSVTSLRVAVYNQPDVRSRFHFRQLWFAILVLLAIAGRCSARGQSANASADSSAATSAMEHRLLLVLPFENRTGQTNLDWIGEAVPEILNQRLAAAGFLPISRIDRQYALTHLGLPVNFRPSRATAIRIAQTLDADYVVIGSYTLQGQRFTTSTQILDINTLHLGQPLQQEADMSRLLEVLNSTAWRVAKALDPQYNVAENTFVATGSDLRIDGFENYIRGLVDPNAADRIRHLKDAVQINPKYSSAWLALGLADFNDQQYELAATALGHLPKSDPNALLAEFYRGLAYFYTGNYAMAEDAFGFIAGQLPLSEVLNNEGVAQSRRGRDGSSLFRRAIANDSADADYDFNLAVALNRKGDHAGAVAAITEALKLRPQDSEAQSFAVHLQGQTEGGPASTFTPPPPSSAIAATDPTAASGPLERIKRNFNDASFRQAAFAIEQMQSLRMDAMPRPAHAAELTREGERYLGEGLLLEAEREFQAALALDNSNAAAHAGLAEVRERDGDSEAARREAQTSIRLQPSSPAYIVLARIDLAASQTTAAAAEVQQALALDPANATARTLKQTIQKSQ
jgi:tetratricopeptide (TPR) repeat protein